VARHVATGYAKLHDPFDLETAKGCHEVSILRVDGALPDLRLRSMHNHFGNCGRSYPGILAFDVHDEKALQ
jgi:hypothetical protein